MSTPTTTEPSYTEVIEANVKVFQTLAASYDETEPHFRPENQQRVRSVIESVVDESGAKRGEARMLDLGCGTGFMINLSRHLCSEIQGVDISTEMLSRVRKDGGYPVTLHQHDTGTVSLPENYFDVATAYSFLHHLQDIAPTVATACRSLRKGGVFYADLEPNGYFLRALSALDRHGKFHANVEREFYQLVDKDVEVTQQIDVPTGTFTTSEYGKSLKGGFIEEDLITLYLKAGFSKVTISYNWFIGQGGMVNDPALTKEVALEHARRTHQVLEQALPLTRHLFKYLSIRAVK